MSEQPTIGFKRNIGLFMAVMIGIGAMMGPGIFALPGELAKLVGPLGILSYLALGLIVIPTALNYSELGASIPLAGGGYTFVSRLAPKPVAFLTGWFFWIGNVLACVVAAVIRGKKFVVPRGGTTIAVGDHVVFVGPASAIKDAQDLFLVKN